MRKTHNLIYSPFSAVAESIYMSGVTLRSRLPLSGEVGRLPSKYLPSRIITS